MDSFLAGRLSKPKSMKKPFSSNRRSALAASLAVGTVAALSSASAHAQRHDPASSGRRSATPPEESRALAVLDEIHRTQRYLSVPEADGRLLRMLVESTGAKHVVEIGTSTGYSGLWLLIALMKTGGRLTTYEIDRGRHEAARANYDRAGMLKLATLVLGDAHAEVAKLKEAVDLVFIDADKEGYLDYLRKLRRWCARAG